MSSSDFDEYWKARVASRRIQRKGFPKSKRSSTKYGYVYLMSHTGMGVLKVGYTTRRSDFELGRISQHVDQGFERVRVARFENREEAKLLEKDILWLWSRHGVRRTLKSWEMPQGGGTEVAEDCELARKIFGRAVAAKRRGVDPRTLLAPKAKSPSGSKRNLKEPSPVKQVDKKIQVGRIRSAIRDVSVVGISFHQGASGLYLRAGDRVSGWVVAERFNQHDRNALAVYTDEGQLGYLPRAVSAAIAPTFWELPEGVQVDIEVPVERQGAFKIRRVGERIRGL